MRSISNRTSRAALSPSTGAAHLSEAAGQHLGGQRRHHPDLPGARLSVGLPHRQRQAALANLLLLAVLLPFWSSLLCAPCPGFVMLQKEGVVNDLLVALGLVAEDGRLIMVYNMIGTMVTMTQLLLPFLILPLCAVMHGIPPLHLRAAALPRRQPTTSIPARLLAADPAGRGGWFAAGLHSGHRLLHCPGLGGRAHRAVHLQPHRLPHAVFPQLGFGRRRSTSCCWFACWSSS